MDIINCGLLLTIMLMGYSAYRLKKIMNAAVKIRVSTQTFSKSVNQSIHNNSIYLDNTLHYNSETGELTGGKRKNELYYETIINQSR